MLHPVEYRSVIKFFVLRGDNNQEILNQLQTTYGNICPSRTTIYDWIRQFKHGRQSVFDDEKVGRPCEISDQKREECLQIVKEERRITIKDISQRLNVSTGGVHAILNESGVRKLSSRFVPSFLSSEMCENRRECCQANLLIFDEHGDQFLRNIITVDETPLSLYIPETKRESSEWKFPEETSSRKMRSGTCHRKSLMLTIFWDQSGVICTDFAEKGLRINSTYYSNLVDTCRRNRRKPQGLPLWLLQDNAPIHKSAETMAVIEKNGFVLLDHPPYSPDLAPSDFYLFRHMKKHLRGKIYQNPADLKQSVELFLKDQSPVFFKNAFLELIHRWKKCVDQNGSYIEK